ncbi:MAG: hypothetical protein FJ126_00790 [Deltaproteobacteria bacterium]|nr:hypothetical protein [Deltaproteobacteria bacterium]
MVLVFAYCLAASAEAEPKVGQSVGNVKFGKPLSDEDAKYLGLDKAAEFTLKDIKAPYVFIESMNTT